jgi:hypothetical protein
MTELDRAWLAEWLSSQESALSVPLTLEARHFLLSIVSEAFEKRRAEAWPAENLAHSTPIQDALAGEVGLTIRLLLFDAVEEAARRAGDEVLLIDLLAVIHRRWCRIWPFCRPPEDGSQEQKLGSIRAAS